MIHTKKCFTSFNCGRVWGPGLVVVNDVSRYSDRWGGQDGDWHRRWDSRTDVFGSQQQVGGLRVGAETPDQQQHVSMYLVRHLHYSQERDYIYSLDIFPWLYLVLVSLPVYVCVCLPECGGLGGGENDEAEESPRLELLHLHEWPSLHGASLGAGGRWCQPRSSYLQIPVTPPPPPTVSPDELNQSQFTWLPPGSLYLGALLGKLGVSTLRMFKLFTQRKMYLFHYLWSVPTQINNICKSLFLWKQFTVMSTLYQERGIQSKYSSQLKLKYCLSVKLHSVFA